MLIFHLWKMLIKCLKKTYAFKSVGNRWNSMELLGLRIFSHVFTQHFVPNGILALIFLFDQYFCR